MRTTMTGENQNHAADDARATDKPLADARRELAAQQRELAQHAIETSDRIGPVDVGALVEHLASGGTIRSYCDAHGHSSATIYRVIGKDSETAKRIAHAREAGASALVEQALAIVDGESPDDPQDVARRRLRAETRLKVAAAVAPAIYGNAKNGGGTQVSVTIATGVPRAALRFDADAETPSNSSD